VKFNTKLSGDFAKRLTDRQAKYSGRTASAVLRVPEALHWWYWQEFGTPPYPIDPVNAKALAFPGQDGNTVFRSHVDFPGLRPRRAVTSVLPEVEAAAGASLRAAFEAGAADDPAILQQAIVAATEQAKVIIVASIADKMPNTRADGRLQGSTASDVFSQQSEVVNLSE
jgi:hypothetical protein